MKRWERKDERSGDLSSRLVPNLLLHVYSQNYWRLRDTDVDDSPESGCEPLDDPSGRSSGRTTCVVQTTGRVPSKTRVSVTFIEILCCVIYDWDNVVNHQFLLHEDRRNQIWRGTIRTSMCPKGSRVSQSMREGVGSSCPSPTVSPEVCPLSLVLGMLSCLSVDRGAVRVLGPERDVFSFYFYFRKTEKWWSTDPLFMRMSVWVLCSTSLYTRYCHRVYFVTPWWLGFVIRRMTNPSLSPYPPTPSFPS